MVQIIQVRTKAEADAVRMLVLEFVAWLGERYPDEVERIARYFASGAH